MRIDGDKVREAIIGEAKSIAAGNWGAWECSLGGLVALVEVASKLDKEFGDDFWAEVFTIKEDYAKQLKDLGIGRTTPQDFLRR